MGGRRQLEQLTSSVPAIYELSLGSTSVQYGMSGWCATFLMRTPPAPACPPPTPPRGVCGRGVLFNDLGRPRWPPCLPACSAVLLTAVTRVLGLVHSGFGFPLAGRKLATSPKPRISQCIKLKLMTYSHDITCMIYIFLRN
jgi:hypothetical protein